MATSLTRQDFVLTGTRPTQRLYMKTRLVVTGKKILPFAEAEGLVTDEDVFKAIS